MYKGTFFWVLFYLSTYNYIYAQVREDRKPWVIKTNVTSLVDVFSFPTSQFAVERKLTKFISVCPEVGFQIYDPINRHSDTTILSSKGFKLNTEFRFYLFDFLYSGGHIEKARSLYVGVQPFYRSRQYTSSISYAKSAAAPPTDFLVDEFGVKNTNYGVNITTGFQKVIFRNFVFDAYMGLGLMKKIIRNTNRVFNREVDFTHESPDFHINFNLSETSGIFPNLSFGFRIGYAL